MKLGIYPGSFNPFHKGHEDILVKALKIFDKVIILQSKNQAGLNKDFLKIAIKYDNVECGFFKGLLVDVVKQLKPTAIIRGLRNGYDLQYETNLQYNNEDLGIDIPFVCFICNRNNSHISSSSIREILSFK